ncbi:hypothetical protein PAJ34TS1_30270 [Paenibacillus azoreducens]|uniref:Uncharacterized protein n=1 Tax=Paenibacillus azoreducens TaxID=116718 RepID=A0A919YCA1_9BACL|nr:hypothetical protein J34TS1_18430 [Paenibacillus azoreducens]
MQLTKPELVDLLIRMEQYIAYQNHYWLKREFVKTQLEIDLECSIDDLNAEKDSIIFVEAKENPGRRPFPRKAHFSKLCLWENQL